MDDRIAIGGWMVMATAVASPWRLAMMDLENRLVPVSARPTCP